MGLKMLLVHKRERAADSDLGPSGADGDLTNPTNEESGSYLLANYTLLSHETLVPIGICSRKPP